MVLCMFAAAISVPASAQAPNPDIADVNEALGVGVNLGNALEAPREGDWGLTLQAEYFELIAEAGFAHVRVPIKFSAYADATAPYTIPEADPSVVNAASLWERIDWVIDQAETNGLYVILDLHHYDELHEAPAAHRDRYLAIWDQIATRYSDAGPLVLFELNEVPPFVIDWHCERHPGAGLARLVEASRRFETRSDDEGPLSPWITWPTVHRGDADGRRPVRLSGRRPTSPTGPAPRGDRPPLRRRP